MLLLRGYDLDLNSNLFQSDAWHSAWTDVWGGSNPIQMSDAPHHKHFYQVTQQLKGWLYVDSFVPCGSHSDANSGVRSEYFQISERFSEAIVAQAITSFAGQMIIPDVIVQGPTAKVIASLVAKSGCQLVVRNKELAYSVDCREGDFERYLFQLSGNTRAKVFNRRTRLKTMGTVTVGNMWPDVDAFIDILNHFHEARWSKPCFQGKNLSFVKTLLLNLGKQNKAVNLSALKLDQRVVSVALDIEYGNRVFNLQLGYDQSLSKGLSLGLLHLGYSIEDAMKKPGIYWYDMLAGQGKNTAYKQKLATSAIELADFVVVKPKWLQWLYQINELRRSNR
ncbi:GNAT family N-acetyltransferase [Reinekea sp. G2M2-21]|uniref:GNAT family N-acetyltransferase n=1 Tax=Reinekea sp. G2M2-21 TaxID=2788942 RepID=UPI0018AA08F9|nr:GNAT family N-acetyltransferase [Reinekea sp. G2M2-21]